MAVGSCVVALVYHSRQALWKHIDRSVRLGRGKECIAKRGYGSAGLQIRDSGDGVRANAPYRPSFWWNSKATSRGVSYGMERNSGRIARSLC